MKIVLVTSHNLCGFVEAHQESTLAVKCGEQTADDGGAEFRVGYQVPSVEVRFEDLHVTASVYAAAGINRPQRPANL